MALLLIVRSFLLDLINQDLKVRSIANRIEVAFRSQKVKVEKSALDRVS